MYELVAWENPRAANSVFKRIRSTAARVGEFPEIGRCGQVHGTREVIVNDPPCIVVYRVGSEGTEIIRVLHTSVGRPSLGH